MNKNTLFLLLLTLSSMPVLVCLQSKKSYPRDLSKEIKQPECMEDRLKLLAKGLGKGILTVSSVVAIYLAVKNAYNASCFDNEAIVRAFFKEEIDRDGDNNENFQKILPEARKKDALKPYYYLLAAAMATLIPYAHYKLKIPQEAWLSIKAAFGPCKKVS